MVGALALAGIVSYLHNQTSPTMQPASLERSVAAASPQSSRLASFESHREPVKTNVETEEEYNKEESASEIQPAPYQGDTIIPSLMQSRYNINMSTVGKIIEDSLDYMNLAKPTAENRTVGMRAYVVELDEGTRLEYIPTTNNDGSRELVFSIDPTKDDPISYLKYITLQIRIAVDSEGKIKRMECKPTLDADIENNQWGAIAYYEAMRDMRAPIAQDIVWERNQEGILEARVIERGIREIVVLGKDEEDPLILLNCEELSGYTATPTYRERATFERIVEKATQGL